jgi:hypothetical protein
MMWLRRGRMMDRETLARLVELREEFARIYRRPVNRFVSLGFSMDGEEPRLNVFVDQRYNADDIPDRFQGIRIHIQESQGGVLAIGSVTKDLA